MSEDAAEYKVTAGPTTFVSATEPPRDRPIWIVANILVQEDLGCYADPYEGYAQWKGEGTQDWLDRRGMSIRQIFGASMNILEWKELAERATNAPEHETTTSTSLYHYGEDSQMPGGPGFYCAVRISHDPTYVCLIDTPLDGPHATRAGAVTALTALLSATPVPEAPIKEDRYQ